ncbi:hypothetical protein XENTR_v10012258 [Xenopus tropicalis]|uniref:Tctex1 domain-containing protein 1-A n=1 Tax=Xenopus tropicalis TaxID=8364 RepID=A0A803JWZ7_XENTR|nr:tctex1 domain-containing protein 1-A [Xenopus tropicalis]KAE8610840.1 hypothetical protein XENTR_v10012258 [Xenopus tropicalis]|eukprot:XP_004913533.1 PREDICTED: tctex1 domain-containing protein 1-A-like [Xenopus tropicalis]
METGRDSVNAHWTFPKPKSHHRRSKSGAFRHLPDTPIKPTGSQQAQRPGARGRNDTHDKGKPRSRTGLGAEETQTMESALELQPRRIFSAEEVSKLIKSILEKQLQDSEYDATGSQQRALELVQLVKEAVKSLGYERYKLVCYIVLGPVSQGALCCCSRSVWSPTSDTYAEFVFRNQSLFALCIVYAGYYE